MRVLILWADNVSGNFGVRVLAQGMAALARRAWGHDVEIGFQDYGVGDSTVSFGARAIARDVGRRRGQIKERIASYDVVVDSGAGDSFADIYGLQRLSSMVYAREAAHRIGVPVVMGPQTIGPFETAVGRMAARRMLRTSTTVLSRDSRSAAYAQQLGRPVDGHSTDVVFALPRTEPSTRVGVLVNVSGLLWFSDRHVASAEYRRSIGELVRRLRADGREVSLLAHTVNPVHEVDDVAASHELLRELGVDLRLVIPEQLRDVRRAVASAELVIGARMHATLNALAEGTPAVPWAYSRKFEPLLEDLGWTFVVDLHREKDPVSRTQEILASYDDASLRRQVNQVVHGTGERLEVAVQLMKEHVHRG